MKSGTPKATFGLKNIIGLKAASPARAVDVVSEASAWLKSALGGAEVPYDYSPVEENDHFGFSAFTILRTYRGERVNLDIKVSEIKGTPYVAAEVHTLGRLSASLFPFYGEIATEPEQELLLHYIADFLLGTKP